MVSKYFLCLKLAQLVLILISKMAKYVFILNALSLIHASITGNLEQPENGIERIAGEQATYLPEFVWGYNRHFLYNRGNGCSAKPGKKH